MNKTNQILMAYEYNKEVIGIKREVAKCFNVTAQYVGQIIKKSQTIKKIKTMPIVSKSLKHKPEVSTSLNNEALRLLIRTEIKDILGITS
ncbi:MAG: hypothetical protein KAS62_05540 [Candidatus Delongbacteria bacterium]|nr:hypothetical protein [Candidatus Delongbacteria bacterium]